MDSVGVLLGRVDPSRQDKVGGVDPDHAMVADLLRKFGTGHESVVVVVGPVKHLGAGVGDVVDVVASLAS